MMISSMANVSAVVQEQVGDPITPSVVLIKVMNKKVLLASSLLGLAPKPVVVGSVDENWGSTD